MRRPPSSVKGPDYSYDETHYLASDGDHHNAAGHERIAAAVAEALKPMFQPLRASRVPVTRSRPPGRSAALFH